MPTASVNGTEIYYEIHGAGESLLLVAGFACDHTVWSLVIPAWLRTIASSRLTIGGSGNHRALLSVPAFA